VLVGEEADVGGEATTLLLPPPPAILECLGPAMAAASPADWPRIAPGDLALLQYTGGTTGTPRAAMLTHANLTAAIASYDAWSIGQGLARPGEDIVICVLPLFHIYALTSILLRQIHNGSLILLRPRFDADATLADIEAGRATTLPAVPTIWIALASRPDLARRDLSSLRFGGSGGAPLPVEVAARIMSLTGLRIGGGWGMTETSPAGTYVPSTGDVPAGTIGLPLPGVEMGVVALDDPTRELPPGETGEFRVRGPNVTAGYWRRPEETAAAFVDGYLLTGDIGHMDTNGFFFLTDRKKDLIISGGFNVYPQMIEQAIYEHPAIEECLVVGVPDAYRGEAAKAFVKVRAGQVAPTLEELRAFLAGRLGRHELPAALEVRASLPRTPVGKLTKTGLREEERRKALASAPSAAPS
jgi:long-chain acyl-CoA synthetase